MSDPADNIVWHAGHLSDEDRTRHLGQRGAVIWFTGLSGSGKSTLARELERRLVLQGHWAMVLDGDNLRFGLNKDSRTLREKNGYSPAAAERFGLGFRQEDRTENIRRVGEVAALLAKNNIIAISAFISPLRSDREAARNLVPSGQFFEIYCAAPLDVCEKRDPKGLYRRARAGEVQDFTGIDSPYEPPSHPDLTLDTTRESPDTLVDRVVSRLVEQNVIRATK